jgi:hypothetical protein
MYRFPFVSVQAPVGPSTVAEVACPVRTDVRMPFPVEKEKTIHTCSKKEARTNQQQC